MLLQIAAGGATFPAAAQAPPVRRAATGITAETSAYSVVLTAVATNYDGVTGLAAYEPANELAIAGASAGHDFELVASDGLRRPFSAANGIADGARIATARSDNGTFRAGELFAPAGNRIVRVSADGATVQSAWVTLPGESSITALTVDRTGAFGGDVIAVTAAGNVWRINAAAAATLVASVGTALGSVTTLANDPGRHGPWAGCIVAGAETQPLLYAIATNGTIAPLQTSVVPHDLAVVTAHENFFGLDGADRKVWAAPSSAFAGMIGDVVVAQGAPGVLTRIHWNGSAFETSELARVAEWRQIVFSPAGVGAIHTARRPYDRIAVVRHAPLLSSGRIEGALWQLSPESVTLDGSDVITSDLLVPGLPQVATSGNPAFGGTVEGDGQPTPSTHTVSITGHSTLGHLITRTDAMTLAPVAAFTPTTNTRDVSLTSASGSAGDFATLRDLSLSGKAGAVSVPPGRYGRFTASGRAAFVLGSEGATQPAAYELDSLTLSGGTELRVAGPVVLTVNNGAVLTGATIGAAEEPRNLVLRVAGGGLRIDGRSVLYAIVRAPQSTVTIDGGGRLRGTVSCDRLDLSGVVQLTETDIPPPPVNRPPAVDAGADASVTLPESATLVGSVADDGLPGSSLTSTWTRVSGPAEVTFADPHATSTAAMFPAPGTFVLRLTANDGELASSDDVTIIVKPRNQAPVANAGADQSIELPSAAALSGNFTDDGLPQSTVTTQWTFVSGPGAVAFADAGAPVTTATFSVAGVYVLRLTANDGELSSSDDVTVTAAPENHAPVVSAGADQFIELPQALTLAGTATDDGLPDGSSLTKNWTVASGPGAVTFADATQVATTATFSQPGTYVLRLTATDGRFSISDDLTVTVDPTNAAPTVDAGADQTIELPATAALSAQVHDDGYPRDSQLAITWSGPDGVTLSDAHTAATTATFAAAGTFTLQVTATDGVQTASDTVVINVNPANAAPAVNAGVDQTIELPAPATLTATVDDADPVTVKWTRLSGPAEVVFSADTEATTSITFTADGVYTFRITASDGHLSASDDVIVTVLAQNQPPAVDAGADQLVRLPAGAMLNASASDDGNPAGATLAVRWTKVSGAGEVTFADATARQTQTTFSAPGLYVLRITADDSKLQVSDDVTITVLAANSAPIVSAGPDLGIALPATATLSGTATDDGAPAPLTYAWTTVSGPANVAFATPLQATTTASFAGAGTFVLRLTVSDGEFSSSDDVTVVVTAANTAPVVDAGADFRVNVGEVATLNGQVTDDGLPSGSTLAAHWTTLSGPGVPLFTDANAAQTTAAFAVTGIYVLRLAATDGALSASDDVTVAVVRPPVADFTVPAISRNVLRWKNNLASIITTATIVAETSNDSSNIGANAIDDSPYTRWRSGNGQTQNQALTIRLGGDGTRPFDRIRIANDQSPTESVKNFRFQISSTTTDDAAFTTVLTSVLNPAGGIQEFPLDAPVTARYARFVFIDNYGATFMGIRDVEVVAADGGGLDRIGAVNLADSSQSADVVAASFWVRNPILALDGNPGTWWVAGAAANAFMTVRLSQQSRIDRVRLVSGATDGARPRDFTIEVAAEAAGPYTNVLTATLANQDGWQQFALPGGAVKARFVRLTVINNYGSGSAIVLNDFEVLSADRPSVSTMYSPYQRPELMFDNDVNTQWSTGAGRVAGEFAIVHLPDSEPRLVEAVEVQGYPSSTAESIRDFDVFISATTDDDAEFRLAVSGTVNPQFGLQRFDFPGGPARARYVKLVIKSNNGGGYVLVPTFHVLTIQHGGNLVSVPTPWPRPVNGSPALAANGATVIASTGSNAVSMLDYVSNSGWITSGLANQFATIALGGDTPRSVSGVRIVPSFSGTGSVQNFEVWVSSTTTDDSAFTKVLTAAATTEQKIQNFFFPGGAVPVRYVKYVPLTRFGTTTTIQTNVFDVILPVHPGGAVAASSTSGYFFPEGATSAAQNVNPWVSVTGFNEWLTVALPGGATRSVYGVTIQPSSFAPKDFDILVSNTTADDGAFTLVYSGAYSANQKTHRFGRAYDAKYVRFLFKNGSPAGAQFNIGRLDVLSVPDDGGAVLGASAGLGENADPSLAIDVAPANGGWVPESFKINDQTFTVALPGAKLWRVDHVALQQGTSCCPYLAPRDFEIQVSAGDLSDASYVTVYRGTLRPDFSPEHCFFPAVSARAVRLLVRNNWGGSSFVVQNFWVFSPQVGPRTARFLDTSIPGARTIVAWSWTFGDGATSNDRDPVHVFPGAGTYEVGLTVTDSDGLTTRRTMQYTVFGDPNVDYTVSPASPTEVAAVFFTDTSSSPSGAIATSDWTFGDGSAPQVNQKTVGHVYLDSGSYAVRHTVSDIRGVTVTATRTLSVANVPPTVSAGPDLAVPWGEPFGAKAVVSDISDADRPTIRCHWDFGDGTGTDLTNCAAGAAVVHRYATMGTFTATLTATDKDGGSASDSVVTTTSKRTTLLTYSGARGLAAGGSLALGAVLRDGLSREPLSGTVTFDLEGQTVTAVADANGRAQASLVYTGTSLQPVVNVSFAGDARYTGSTASAPLTCPASQQALDVAQVFDLSSSMTPLLAGAQNAFTHLIDSLLPGRDQASTIIFSDGADVRQPLTGNLELARKAVETFEIYSGTSIESGIDAARAQLTGPLHNPAAAKVIILLSDGEESGGAPNAAASAAKAAGIHIISVRWKNGPLGHDTMLPMASSPSDFYEFTNAAELEPLFQSLPSTMCIAANAAPVPFAGGSQTIALPQTTVTLAGSVYDDGKPTGTVTTTWTQLSGPGVITFGTPNALQTAATMTVAGTYMVRLTAFDGELSSTSDLAIIVKPENQAPVADAGPDITTTMEVELLQNGDAEAPLVNGKIPSWTEVAGTWTATTTGPEPMRGTHTIVSSGATATELVQDVNVTNLLGTIDSGAQKFEFNALVRAGDETPADAAKIMVEYRGQNNASTIALTQTGDITTSHLWDRVTISEFAPPGTRFIRIHLIAARHSGSTNDVWFDALSLRALESALAAPVSKATDDGQPENSLHAAWTQTAGPVTAWLVNATRIDALITTRVPGTYTFRMTVSDTAKSSTDEMSVITLPANAAPVVSAGASATVTLPSTGSLSATATDENPSALAWSWYQLSGPDAVIAQPHAAATDVTFSIAGTYVFRAYADDGGRIGAGEVTVTVNPSPGNHAPIVSAGPDLIVADPPRTATLTGTVTDDGLPEGETLTYAWTSVSGPAAAQFETASQRTTNVYFPTTGTYTLRLSSSDTRLIGSDDLVVHVVTNQPPAVNAGPDVVFTDSQPIPRLTGQATDGEIPPGGALTYQWTRVSGPGNATFATPTQLATSITLSAHGRHVFRLTATDGQLSASDDVAITWDGANTAPTVNAGTDLTVTLPATAALEATVNDDGLPVGGALSMGWSRVSGPAEVTFSAPGSAATTATFTVAGDYVLRLTVTDGESTASDDIAVKVNDAVPAPEVEITYPADGASAAMPVAIVGSVRNSTSWRVDLRLSGSSDAWTALSSGTGDVTAAPVAMFDPTLLPNGLYDVRLTGINAAGESLSDTSTIVVTGAHKFGNFTVAFEDLRVPLSGLPITVIRTYDSRVKRTGDFGAGWNLSVNSARVQENVTPGKSWANVVSNQSSAGIFIPVYCVTPTRAHVVTVTFGDTLVYEFDVTLSPGNGCRQFSPLQEVTIAFKPRPGTFARLEPVGDATALVSGNWPGTSELWGGGLSDPIDFAKFRLTLPDGTVALIDKVQGLEQLTDLSGNELTVSRDGIVHSDGKGVAFHRDALGRIDRITDPAGASLRYTYDANGDLVEVEDRDQHHATFTYGANHFLADIIDPRGVRGTRNQYDGSGRLIAQTDPAGHTMTFSYDLGTRVETVTNRNQQATVNEYDERGNLVKSTDPAGAVRRWTYDDGGNSLTETDPAGKTTAYTYDPDGNRTSVTDPLGHRKEFSFQWPRLPIRAVDEANHVWTSEYDGFGRLTSITGPTAAKETYAYDTKGRRTTLTDPLNRVTQWEYDAYGNVSVERRPGGIVISSTYDANNNRLTSSQTRTAGDGSVETLVTGYTYDHTGHLTTVTYPGGTSEAYEFDAAGQRTASVDAMGHRTTFAYDDLARLTKKTFPDGTFESFTYDAGGQKLTSTDRAGRVTAYAHDPAGHVATVTYPDGKTSTATYDPRGFVLTQTDEAGHTTKFGYDDAGRKTKITNALDEATTLTYEPRGSVASVTQPDGTVIRYEYDENQRVTRVISADGTDTASTFDSLGNKTSSRDAQGRVTTYEYDGFGISKVIDPLHGTTTYTRDETGNVIARTDANGHTTRFIYDAAGRRTKRILPGGAVETYAYDATGHPIRRTDFNGRTTTYEYDQAGRLLRKTPDSFYSEAPVEFTYRPDGRRASMTDATGTTTYVYDGRGRLQSKATPRGTLTYAYDAAGNLAGTTSSHAGGLQATYSWDALNRLNAVADAWSGQTSTYHYGANGELDEVALPNDVSTTYLYDSMGRVMNIDVAAGSTPLTAWTYIRNTSGLITSAAQRNGATSSYAYDELDRLTGETVSGDPAGEDGVLTYTYDAAGNRLSRQSTLPTLPASTYAYDADDRRTGDAYDANGNTLVSGAQTLKYDSENHIVDVNGGVIRYAYDGDGNRIAVTQNGVTTQYLIDDHNPTGYAQVVEELADGALARVYLYGRSRISQRRLDAGAVWKTSYYIYDSIGSVRMLTDEAGGVTDTYAYDAFGNLLHRTGSTPNDYLYTGERFDALAGLYYLRARDLRPGEGRFLSRDAAEGELADPRSFFGYVYANADPVNTTDPTGYTSFSEKALELYVQGQLIAMNNPVWGGVVGVVVGAAVPMEIQVAYPGMTGFPGFMIEGQLAEEVGHHLRTWARLWKDLHWLDRFLGGRNFERMVYTLLRIGEADRQIPILNGVVSNGVKLGGAVVDAIYRGMVLEIKTSEGAVSKSQFRQLALFADNNGIGINFVFLNKPGPGFIPMAQRWAAEMGLQVEVAVNYILE